MKLPRRKFLHLAAGAAALPFAPQVAQAQAYPTRSITMIVPIAAGSSLDVAGRLVAEQHQMAGTSRRVHGLSVKHCTDECRSHSELCDSSGSPQ
jgi:hypothetical protein